MLLPGFLGIIFKHSSKFLLGFLFFFLFSAFSPSLAGAQSSYQTPITDDQEYIKVQKLLVHLSAAFICQLSGFDVLRTEQGCFGEKTAQGIGSAQDEQLGGALGFAVQGISGMYNMPVSTGSYVSNMAQDFGIVKSTYAQETGGGFTALEAIRGLWTRLRDITYIFLVIIFVLIGVGIMLRLKIDPRTVMTIQNQLPKIVIAIIMITFSYPIAGLMIDTMWVTTYAGINLVTGPSASVPCPSGSANNVGDVKQTVALVATRNVLNNPISFVSELFGNQTGCLGSVDGLPGIAGPVASSIGDVVGRTVSSMLGLDSIEGDTCDFDVSVFPPKVKTDFADCTKLAFFGFFKYLAFIIVYLIVLVALLIALFRLWITVLLKSFIYVILGAIAAPLWIVAGLIPGSTMNFTSWVRFMAAHLLVFPATVIMFVLARIIYVQPDLNSPTYSFIPPLIANPNAIDNFGNIIAVGIIFVTPEILNMLRDALKSKPGPYASKAILGGLQRGAGPVMGPIGAMVKRQTHYDSKSGEIGGLRYAAMKKYGNLPIVGKNSRLGKVLGMKRIETPPSQ